MEVIKSNKIKREREKKMRKGERETRVVCQ